MDVFTCPCWDQGWSTLLIGTPDEWAFNSTMPPTADMILNKHAHGRIGFLFCTLGPVPAMLTKLQWSLRWRHNDHDGLSYHQPHGCLLNRLFSRRSKKTSKLRVTGLCAGNSPGPVNSPHKGSVTWKMFPFDDVIMCHMAVMVSPTNH